VVPKIGFIDKVSEFVSFGYISTLFMLYVTTDPNLMIILNVIRIYGLVFGHIPHNNDIMPRL